MDVYIRAASGATLATYKPHQPIDRNDMQHGLPATLLTFLVFSEHFFYFSPHFCVSFNTQIFLLAGIIRPEQPRSDDRPVWGGFAFIGRI